MKRFKYISYLKARRMIRKIMKISDKNDVIDFAKPDYTCIVCGKDVTSLLKEGESLISAGYVRIIPYAYKVCLCDKHKHYSNKQICNIIESP